MVRRFMAVICAFCLVGSILRINSPVSAQVEREADVLAITLTDDQFGNALHGLPVMLTPEQIAAIAELIGAEPCALVIPMEEFTGPRLPTVLRVPVRYFSK